MSTTSLFLDPAQTVHFLSLFTYLSKLSDIFYSEELLRAEDKHEPFPIVNAYYKYLKGKNETEAKQRLVQKLLEGSELYGGERNETIDMGYVNSTLDYIITNAVFSQSGNLYGCLAEIASMLTSLKLSVFKTKVLDQLSHFRQLKNDGDVSNLTKLATDKIAETIIWPLFPNTPNDMEIISLKYIYALGGYNLAKSAQMNMTDIPFSKYVTLGMTIEASAIGDELPISILQFFALPAIIFYANNQTEKFNQQTTKKLIKDENFWSEAFLTLFTYMNSTLEMIHQEELETNSFYQFHLAMSTFKNRTVMARAIILQVCRFNETYTESLIEDYKTYSASTDCYKGGKQLPNLESIYDNQFHRIKEKYRLMEIDFIRSAFDDFPIVRDLINSPQTIVYRSFPIPYDMRCSMCSPRIPSFNPNINFFAIKSKGEKEFYALEQNENNVTLLIQKDNSKFNKRVGLPEGRNLELSGFIVIYKRDEEDFEKFVQRFAEIKAEEFKNKLFEYGYDRTSMEKFYEIVKSFIPFYDCVKFAKAGEQGVAAFSCFGDVVSFVPLAGLLNAGIKVTRVTAGRFLLASGLTLKTFTLRQAILATMTTGLREAAMGFSDMFTKVILTKQMFRSVSIGILRSLDPGFELLGKLSWHGSVMIGKVINKAFKYIGKKFPTLNFKYAKYETILRFNEKPPNDLKRIPNFEIEGHEVYQSIYPGGENPFGPKYIRLSQGYAELRRMIGIKKEVPVIVSRIKRGRVFYRKVNLQTDEPSGLEMKLNKEGLLENARQPFRKHIYKIKTEGLGGRRELMAMRDKSIDDAAKVVSDANIGISNEDARITLRHYLLAFNNPSSIDDLIDSGTNFMEFNVDVLPPNSFMNPKHINPKNPVNPDDPSNLMNSDLNDLVNPNPGNFADANVGITDLLKDYNADPLTDQALNEYLQLPTFRIFALDWARTGGIHERYKDYFVKNFEEMERLLYTSRLETAHSLNFQKAYNSIYALYGPNFTARYRVSLEQAVFKYVVYNAWRHVSFEDYYVLLVWRQWGYRAISERRSGSILLKKALYRLAIRQSSDECTKKVLYHVESKLREPNFSPSSNMIDETVLSKHFFMATDSDNVLQKEIIKNGYYKKVLVHKLIVDSTSLIVDMSKLLNEESPFVILPGTTFKIRKMEETVVTGYRVRQMELESLPVVKETLLARWMNELDALPSL